MEEQKTNAECQGMKCWSSLKNCGHGHMILRWILGLVILSMVFWMGVRVGEFKSMFSSYGAGRGDHYYIGGYGGSRQNYPMMYNGYRGRGMMNGGGFKTNNVPQQGQETAPTAPQQ